ncbi:CpaD family pilus assembly lipoprotein [Chelativorans sp. AA-79]|uniref:CpaD family pilus assembly protein n=1 Tax=Chelativorans sp. AA-79 TaxID=3028735 RepID=UPI0023F73731|nr:CpaD family pilus assembly lipoprotein [Chelativorans sp. AA-79]WEX09335.1 CpaD family pilus assembly lipoprotein [Chelativorans sp. AA-79]
MSGSLKRGMAAILVIAAAAAIAGCARRDSIAVGAVPDDYRTNHPIVLTEKEQTLDLPVAILAYRMTPQQKAAIDGFMEHYGESGQAIVTILVPAGSPNGPAAGRVSEDIAAFLYRGGVPKGRLQILPYQAPSDQVAPIRISYAVVKAATGQCGRWPDDLLDNAGNRHYANFGCAYQNNLAAQVANPMDFLGPRKTTPIDAENRGTAIGRYKNGEVADDFWVRSEVDY